MGGRGASSSLPSLNPSGGGGGFGEDYVWDEYAGSPSTLREALGAKGRPMSTYNAVNGANPFWDGNYREYSENCQRAVIATEARFRGYNVIAQATYENDTMPLNNNYLKAFENAKMINVGKSTAPATTRNVEETMREFGDGSRAIMSFQWKEGRDGHVINVVNRKGRIYYYDGQVGGQYKNVSSTLFPKTRTDSVRLTRVDNLDFADDARLAVRQNPIRNQG